MDPMVIILLPFMIGAAAYIILPLGTSKKERMYPSTISNPRTRKRVEIAKWACLIGIVLTVVLFLIFKAVGLIKA